MKQFILSLVAVVALVASARAAAPAAPDTLVGQQQLIRKISAQMCQRLEAENKTSALTQLTPAQAQQLLTDVTQSSMGEAVEEMSKVMEANKVKSPKKLGEQIGGAVVIDLVRQCPQGRQLLVAMIGQQVMGNVPFKAGERDMLNGISTDICQRIDKENAVTPLSARTVTERKQVLAKAMQGGIFHQMEPLADFYGTDGLQNNGTMESVGRKIAYLMLESCPDYILQMGIDEYLKKK